MPKPISKPTVTKSHFDRTVRALRRQMDDMRGEFVAERQRIAREAYASGMSDAEDEPLVNFGGKTYQRGYRTMSVTVRDETTTSQEAAIERSYRQWATNPLMHAITSIRADYVWGDGPTITTDWPEVENVIGTSEPLKRGGHWKDPVNDWPGKGHQRVTDLGLYGELILEAFVRYDGVIGDGRVKLGAIDASEIDQIITSAHNREEIVAIRLKGIAGDNQNKGRLLKVITEDETGRLVGVLRDDLAASRSYEAGTIRRVAGRRWRVEQANEQTDHFKSGWENTRVTETCYGRGWRVSEQYDGVMYQDTVGEEVNGVPFDGQCFVCQVNKTSIGLRGRPDLLSECDWFDRFDQVFFDIVEWVALMRDKLWDLEVDSDDTKVVADYKRELVGSSGQAGGVFGHNKLVKLTAINPDLKTADWSGLYEVLVNFLAGGGRVASYMLGSGGDANLATATAMGSPIYRGFKTRQGVVQRFIETILTYQIDCAVEAGVLPEYLDTGESEDTGEVDPGGKPILKPIVIPARESFTVTMPEISPRDTANAAQTFAAIVTATTTAHSMSLLPKDEAIELIARGAELLGVDFDQDDILRRLGEANAPDTTALADALDKIGKNDAVTDGGKMLTVGALNTGTPSGNGNTAAPSGVLAAIAGNGTGEVKQG